MVDSSSASQSNVDINQIATDLNGKADVDMTNATIPYVVSRTATDGGGS